MDNSDLPDDKRDEQLAQSYELLVLYGIPVSAATAKEMEPAYRRVHLRGLDPLRKNQPHP